MTDQPTEAAREPLFPPLPKPAYTIPYGWDASMDGYTADQMHAYLIADRAARALTQGDLSEAQWYDIASAHATGEWNGDGYLDSIKAVGRAAIGAAAPSALVASPVEMQPVSSITKTAPKRIWLNVFDSADGEELTFPEDTEGVTWADQEVGDLDVEYIRADLASLAAIPVAAKVLP